MNHLTTETRNIQTMHLDEMNLSDALKNYESRRSIST